LNINNSKIEIEAVEACKKIRKLILETANKSKTSHVASCLSVVELLFAAHYKTSRKENSVILSKGHAANAQYSTLQVLGEIEFSSDLFCSEGSEFYGHVNHIVSNKIPLSTGSLGHGMPFAAGLALGKKMEGIDSLTIVIISDGECDEGTTWETAMIASHHKLSNLLVVVDRNKLQSLTTTEDTLALEPLKDKWESFGWECVEVDGHDILEIFSALQTSDKPKCVIANTVKGNGISFMENKVEWHYKFPSDEELFNALKEIQ
jgi:transketolase